MRYRIQPLPLVETAAWLTGLAAMWEQRLTAVGPVAAAAARSSRGDRAGVTERAD